MKAGTIIGKCMPRHRAAEFRCFLDTVEKNVPADLDIHVVMDNASSHKTKLISDWFAKRPKWHPHFTPTSSSWINQVERFFALLTEQQIKRGAVPIYLSIVPALADPARDARLFSGIFVLVIASLIVQGWTIAPVGRLLGYGRVE